MFFWDWQAESFTLEISVIKESKKGDDKDNGQIIFFQSGHSRAEHTANYCPIIHHDFPIQLLFLHPRP